MLCSAASGGTLWIVRWTILGKKEFVGVVLTLDWQKPISDMTATGSSL